MLKKDEKNEKKYETITEKILDELDSYQVAREFFDKENHTEEEISEFHDYLLDEENMEENWKGVEMLFYERVNFDTEPSLDSYISLAKLIAKTPELRESWEENQSIEEEIKLV